MSEYTPTIRSGCSAATFSKFNDSPLVMTTSGTVPAHRSATHGQEMLRSGLSPAGYWSTMPTGLTPTASIV